MTAPATLSRTEYANRLFEACRRMRRIINAMQWDEEMQADCHEDRDPEAAMTHYFNVIALTMAMNAITKSPGQLMR